MGLAIQLKVSTNCQSARLQNKMGAKTFSYDLSQDAMSISAAYYRRVGLGGALPHPNLTNEFQRTCAWNDYEYRIRHSTLYISFSVGP